MPVDWSGGAVTEATEAGPGDPNFEDRPLAGGGFKFRLPAPGQKAGFFSESELRSSVASASVRGRRGPGPGPGVLPVAIEMALISLGVARAGAQVPDAQ